jgi:hypothetical protein
MLPLLLLYAGLLQVGEYQFLTLEHKTAGFIVSYCIPGNVETPPNLPQLLALLFQPTLRHYLLYI